MDPALIFFLDHKCLNQKERQKKKNKNQKNPQMFPEVPSLNPQSISEEESSFFTEWPEFVP